HFVLRGDLTLALVDDVFEDVLYDFSGGTSSQRGARRREVHFLGNGNCNNLAHSIGWIDDSEMQGQGGGGIDPGGYSDREHERRPKRREATIQACAIYNLDWFDGLARPS